MSKHLLRRPTSIAEMVERIQNFRSKEAWQAAQNLTARPSDVFIATYSKSGTTWMQQIVHGLRSGGSMDFVEISAVVPWLESALDMGIDPEADQQWEPRAFKSHMMWRDLPKGGRYITVFRDPVSVLPSFHRFFEGWWFEPGSVTLDEFALEFYIGGSASGKHWDHFVDWWPQIDRDDVLALSYEDMAARPSAVPGVVAEFLGFERTTTELQTVISQSSREFMSDHADQFDEQLIRAARDELWGLPPGGDSAKVKPTRIAPALSESVEDALEAIWKETVTAALGFDSYAELRAALPDRLGVR